MTPSPDDGNQAPAMILLPHRQIKLGPMNKRAQGATEYLLMLTAVLLVVAGITAMIYVSASALGSSVGGDIDNTMENTIIPGLVGAFSLV